DQANGPTELLVGLPSSAVYFKLDARGWHDLASDPELEDETIDELRETIIGAMQGGSKLGYIDGGMHGMTGLIEALSAFSPVNLASESREKLCFAANILN